MRNPKKKDDGKGDKLKDKIRGGGAAGRAHQFNLEHGIDDNENAESAESSDKSEKNADLEESQRKHCLQD